MELTKLFFPLLIQVDLLLFLLSRSCVCLFSSDSTVWKFLFCSNLPFSCRWQLPPSPTHSLFPESSDAASTRALVFTCRAHKRKSALDVCSRREGRKNNKKSKHASSHMKQTDGHIFFAGTLSCCKRYFLSLLLLSCKLTGFSCVEDNKHIRKILSFTKENVYAN